MQVMPPIDESIPAKIRISEVEKHKETNRVNIENLNKVNKYSLEEYVLVPIKIITMARDFIKHKMQELKQEFSPRFVTVNWMLKRCSQRSYKRSWIIIHSGRNIWTLCRCKRTHDDLNFQNYFNCPILSFCNLDKKKECKESLL
jgi:hypothetical protein